MVVRGLLARASLAASDSELAEARRRAAGGEHDWAVLVGDVERGAAALVEIEVSLTVEIAGIGVETVAAARQRVWLELGQHPAVAAAFVAEISCAAFDDLASRLDALGAPVTVSELEEMHVNVTLGDDLLIACRPDLARRARWAADRPASHNGHLA